MGKPTAHARISVSGHSSMVMSMFRSLETHLHDTVPGQAVLDDTLFDVSRVISSRDVFLPPCIDTTPDNDSLAVVVFDSFQPASSLRSAKYSKTPPKRSNKRHITFMKRARPNVA